MNGLGFVLNGRAENVAAHPLNDAIVQEPECAVIALVTVRPLLGLAAFFADREIWQDFGS
jgi:hypothetical protein